MSSINKRGFLLAEETLKMIIALIAIGLLVGLLVKVYYVNQDSKDLEMAKESLEKLDDAIKNNLNEVEIFNPEGWVFILYPYDNNIPIICEENDWKNCICLCEKPVLGLPGNYLDNCNNKAPCFENKKEFELNPTPLEIDGRIVLNLDYEKKVITK